MSVRLQGLTPYPRSLKWTIQSNYYRARGTEAWRSGEVPSDITSNYRAAYQHAELLVAALAARYPRGVPRRQPIHVLELASGQGTYCSNFFRAFEDVCREHHLTYHHRLRYYLTDVIPAGLRAAAANPHLARLHREGRLSFHYLNALKPGSFKSLPGSRATFRPRQFHAIVASYVFTVLPVTVLRKQHGTFAEKHIALSYAGAQRLSRQRLAQLVRNPVKAGLLSALRETAAYQPIELRRRFPDADAQAALHDTTDHLPRATFTYPEGGLRCCNTLLPYLVAGGLFIVSDKAYSRTLDFLHPRMAESATHGNSLSHGVNLPLLQAYLRRRGHGTIRTADYHFGIQTMAIVHARPVAPSVARTFDRYFVTTNHNESASAATSAARDFMAMGQWLDAAAYLRRALRWRPGDAKLLGRLGTCYLRLGRLRTGTTLVERARAVDYFDEFLT